MVFQIHDLSRPTFCEHVARIAATSVAFSFTCRYAMVHDDDSSDDYYVFLVPDEGFSKFSLLHDALHTEAVASRLRLDIPYVPHIGIATLKDPHQCRSLPTA
jgi:2'-5' RNA ligase